MDLLGKVEIYIPVDAEVKSFPMWGLPKSVLKRIGLPLSDSEGSGTLTDSPEGICICPAIIRRKGQKLVSHTGNGGTENASLLHTEFRSGQMSFVCPNRTAYKVLKDTVPGKKVSAHTSHTSQLPQGSAPDKYKDAVVIYHGHVYLSTRRSNHSRSQRETREPKPSSHSTIPKRLKKRRSPQARHDPADKELQRKKLRVTLPQTSIKPLQDLLTKTDNHSTTDQELLHDNTPKNPPTACKVTHGEHEKDVFTHKKVDVSSSTAAYSTADGEQAAAEEAADAEPAWFQPPEEEEEEEEEEEQEANDDGAERELPDLDDEEAKADYLQIEKVLDIVESSSWIERESRGAARTSTSLQEEYDFKELAEEEKIARMTAKLRQSEAALLIMTAQSK
ncbi:histone-lysine N-methyltransferase SETD1B [Sander lucioperca]|uniref:histone-lysine N-methyltransferase SETD1B n=1 Tax=Sander lucioperca TaxID=283035 RepID=UPI00125CE6C8|nr:histone-lysine N-methyltransferase SETD1B [Sander lucioperca]